MREVMKASDTAASCDGVPRPVAGEGYIPEVHALPVKGPQGKALGQQCLPLVLCVPDHHHQSPTPLHATSSISETVCQHRLA